MKFLISATVAILILLINGELAAQQPFPISLDANGGEVYVESMDVGSDGDIYLTGSVKNYVDVRFGPGCGDNVTEFEPTGGDRIFVARLHPDPVSSSSDELVWMVIGQSTVSNTGGIFSGKDIEVSTDGTVFFTGTLIGDVEFKRVIGGSPSPISSCISSSDFRHFAGRIESNGTPTWISDTDATVPSYGEGITLDEANNRIFTGGYVGNAFLVSLSFTHGTTFSCLPFCSFTVTPTPGTPNVGFVTQYTLDGENRQAFQIGEKVMALDMDGLDPGFIWVTGSIFNISSDVLLSQIPVNIVTPPCAVYAPFTIPINGVDGDIGLDIDYTSDNNVAITGAFETTCFFPGFGSITTPPGMSDLFVAIYNPIFLNFTAASSTSSLSPFTATTQPYFMRNSCIAADPYSTSHIIIAYDKDMALSTFSDIGYIITKELTTSLVPPIGGPHTTAAAVQIASCACTPVPVNPAARAMEIEYGTMGSFGDRYVAGDYKAEVTIGACVLNGTGSWNDGFVGRVANTHDLFFRETQISETAEDFFVFPNPAHEEITLSYYLETESGSNSMYIYNLLGQLVYQKDLTGREGQNETRLNINLPDGTYFIHLAGKKTVKLMIREN